MNVLNYLNIEIELEDYNGNGMYDIKDFVEAPNEKILKYNKGMKFDCIVSNAPYDRGLHEKFEAKYFELCKGEIIWVAPNSWLNGKSKNKAICDSANKCYFNVESINGNSYFDAAIGSDLSIVFADMTKDSRIIIDGKIYNSIYDYTSYSNDNLLVYFKNKIEYLYKNDNFENYLKAVDGAKHWQLHRELNPQDSWWCIKVPAIRGHISSNSGYMSDFYTLISNNKKELDEFIFGQYKDLSKKTKKGNKTLQYYFAFDNEQNAKGLLNYMMSDFCRICYYLIKVNANVFMGGEFAKIPWFDFSDPVFSKSPSEIDDYLFKKYNISDKIRKHIEELLPDYYKIRNTSYE